MTCTDGHDFESYDSEMVDRNTLVVFYSCLKCGEEIEDTAWIEET